MSVRRISWIALCIFVGCVIAATSVYGATVFYDDFSDGDLQDGDPVTWVPDTEPDDVIAVVDGDLVISAAGSVGGSGRASTVGLNLENASIRTQVRLIEGNVFGVGARWNPSFPSNSARGYFGYVDAEGEVGLGVNGSGEFLGWVMTDLQPLQEDIMMQLDVIGSQISIWAWRTNEEMPSHPIVTRADSRLTAGNIDTFVARFPPNSEPVEGVVRFVHVADTHIPEPSTLLLALVALGVVGGSRKWKRAA
jgi:hypothetical protein